ncbi:MAG: CHAD domain-containing protein [Gemmatimonadetes bacterium]|nr:MAG: CHAD domain-containing protein [Gemmatimonadota bacterium]
MAKAWDVPGLSPDKPLKLCARDIILTRFREMFSYKVGVIANDDIEFVHDFRVSARRLRTVINVFKACFPEKEDRMYFKAIKKIARCFGQARDLDVMIAFLKGYRKSLPKSKRESLGPLISHKQHQRQHQQHRILALFDQLEHDRFEERFIAHFEQIDLPYAVDYPAGLTFRSQAEPILTGALAQLVAYDARIANPHYVDDLHQMRIAAKRLRYMMEVFQVCYPTDAYRNVLHQIKTIQELLGIIHDCDVMMAFLQDYLRQVETKRYEWVIAFQKIPLVEWSENALADHLQTLPQPSDFSGIFSLLLDQHQRRFITYQEFFAFWHSLKNAQFEQRLAELFRTT